MKKMKPIIRIIILLILFSFISQYSFALTPVFNTAQSYTGEAKYKEGSTADEDEADKKAQEAMVTAAKSALNKILEKEQKNGKITSIPDVLSQCQEDHRGKPWSTEPGTHYFYYKFKEGTSISVELTFTREIKEDKKNKKTICINTLTAFGYEVSNTTGKSETSDGTTITSSKEKDQIRDEANNTANSTQEERFPSGWESMNAPAIMKWVQDHEQGVDKLDSKVKTKWIAVIKKYLEDNHLGQAEATTYSLIMQSLGASKEEAIAAYNRSTGDKIFKLPKITTAGGSSSTLDDAMGDADSFLSAGTQDVLEQNNMQAFSRTLYNILLTIGVIIAVIMGAALGIKFMTETGPEGKAEVKKLLIPYITGCVIVFGGFAIWKIVVTVLSGM